MKPMTVEQYSRQRNVTSGSPQRVGPFVTISRAYGCYGYEMALRVAESLNADLATDDAWKVYGSEALAELAQQVHMPLAMLEQERRREPKAVNEFFRHLSNEVTPSCWELRRRITTIVRRLASEGRAILVGHGGSSTTEDLANGLSVRLDAPLVWRAKRIAEIRGIDEAKAMREVQAAQEERQYLAHVYSLRHTHRLCFGLIYDCSRYAPDEIARHVVCMMRIRKMA